MSSSLMHVRTIRLLASICTVLTFALNCSNPANADLVAGWTFNNLTPGPPPSNANQTSYSPTTGAGTLTLSGWTSAATTGITNFTGTTTNTFGGAVAGQALALQGGITGGTVTNNGALLTLGFDLSGFINPILSFATQRTATGFGPAATPNTVSYSTDGVTYTSFATYSPVTSFTAPNGLQTFDFSAIDALDFDSSIFIQIAFFGATNISGNNRIDNIQLNATAATPPSPVPVPGSAIVFMLGTVAVGAARKKIKAALC